MADASRKPAREDSYNLFSYFAFWESQDNNEESGSAQTPEKNVHEVGAKSSPSETACAANDDDLSHNHLPEAGPTTSWSLEDLERSSFLQYVSRLGMNGKDDERVSRSGTPSLSIFKSTTSCSSAAGSLMTEEEREKEDRIDSIVNLLLNENGGGDDGDGDGERYARAAELRHRHSSASSSAATSASSSTASSISTPSRQREARAKKPRSLSALEGDSTSKTEEEEVARQERTTRNRELEDDEKKDEEEDDWSPHNVLDLLAGWLWESQVRVEAEDKQHIDEREDDDGDSDPSTSPADEKEATEEGIKSSPPSSSIGNRSGGRKRSMCESSLRMGQEFWSEWEFSKLILILGPASFVRLD